MRHKKSKSLLNRFTSWKTATIKSLARSLLIHQSIRTTVAKAKAARPLVEKLLSLAKKNDLAAKRKAFSILGDHSLVANLFNEIGPRFKDRSSGFSRIIRMGVRRGDDAKIALMELTEIKKQVKQPKKSKEVKPEETRPKDKQGVPEEEKQVLEKKAKAETAVLEKPPVSKKPAKKFLGGIRSIFKKKSDSL